MIKEFLTLQAFSSKLGKLGIKSVKSFLEHCQDAQSAENLRQQLGINVLPEQWAGGIAVVKELFK